MAYALGLHFNPPPVLIFTLKFNDFKPLKNMPGLPGMFLFIIAFPKLSVLPLRPQGYPGFSGNSLPH